MLNDQTMELVEVLSAIAEPTRLAIVRELLVGDRGFGDLAVLTETPSNRLAHHVGVLERVGLLHRRRSTADARRSYLRVDLEHRVVAALGDLIRPDVGSPPSRLVFVCRGNTARSQLAAAVWNEISEIPAVSAGTHPDARVDAVALEVGRRRGLPLVGAQTSLLDEVRAEGDAVVTVCDRAFELLDDSPWSHWSMDDPTADGSVSAYERAHDDIAVRARWLAGRLRQ